MIIVDPVALGDVAFKRASPKWAFDRTGALVQVPVDTLAVTYDPLDLSKAPYALIEPAATNYTRRTTQFEHTVWDKQSTTGGSGVANAGLAPDGTTTAYEFTAAPSTPNFAWLCQGFAGDSPDASLDWVYSFWVRVAEGTTQVAPAISNLSVATRTSGYQTVTTEWKRIFYAMPSGQLTNTGRLGCGLFLSGQNRKILIWGPQLERGSVPTGYIPNPTDAPVFRAADVVGAGAGVVYSNVPIIESNYDVTETYKKGQRVHDPATHNVFESIIDVNKGKALSDTSSWTPRGATNRYAMLDQYNNTQTTAVDEILLVLSPEVISQGIYVGNVFADEVRISAVDLAEGLVYSTIESLVQANSSSSFYNWLFKRIVRKDYFGTLKMPPYSKALITVCIRKFGGTAACGMCAVGPVDEFGPTFYGFSPEGKDYSTTTFEFDGTSNTKFRPYAKVLTADVQLDNDQIDYVQSRLFDIRQRMIIWFGSSYGATIVAGRYSNFKIVVPYKNYSTMNLKIEGAV